MIETYLLEQLAAVAENGTISAASEALHVSQPSISRSMQKLEVLLGVKLFNRTKNRVELNENGLLAAEYARSILQEQNAMVARVRALDRSRNTITLGASAPGPLMELVPVLTRAYSGMTISSELKPEEELLEGLENDLYQLIVLDHPVESHDLLCVPFGSERLYASLPPGHPAAILKETSFKEMDGTTFLMNANVGIWEGITRTGMPRARLIKQESSEDLGELVQSSSLPSFVTDLTMRLYGLTEGRIAVPFSDPEAEVHFHVVFPRKNQKRFEPFLFSLPDYNKG